MVWSQSEWCERAREGNGCCVVWRSTFYLLPPALLPLAVWQPPPTTKEAWAVGVWFRSTKRIAASRLRATGQNRRTPAILLIDR